MRNERFGAFLREEINLFVEAVKPIGKKIIDLGAGTGNESMILKQAGLSPICVDISSEMVKVCSDKGLAAFVMDFYNLDFPDSSFHGAWMAFSFLHVPKKETSRVLGEVNRILVDGGILHLSLFEGRDEGPRIQDVKKFGVERYFSYYISDELSNIVSNHFSIINTSRLDISPRPTISFLCRKEKTEHDRKF